MKLGDICGGFVGRLAARYGFGDQIMGDWIIISETIRPNGAEGFFLASSSDKDEIIGFARRVLEQIAETSE